MPEIGLWKVFVSLGVPGVALGVLYMLFRKFNFELPRVPRIWVGPVLILFMVLVGAIVFYALTLWAPRHDDTQLTVRPINSESPSNLVIEKVAQFHESATDGLNLDFRISNPTSQDIRINEFRIDLYGVVNPDLQAQSVRKVSARYIVKADDESARVSLAGSQEYYSALAWYPSISSDHAVIKGDLWQEIPREKSDRFQVIFDMKGLPASDHHSAEITLYYSIGNETREAEYSLKLK